jgi:hypothetical protein
MSLDTYLPEGRGRYIIGSAPGDTRNFYYFIPKSPDHARIALQITGSGDYVDSIYTDVILYSPESEIKTVEAGEYSVIKEGRSCHSVELVSEHEKKRFSVFEQPRLGRFRLITPQMATVR